MAASSSVKITYDFTKANSTLNKSTSASTYTVKRGDTLWAISKEYLGAGNRYTEIYNLNKDIIEKTARNHGKTSSDNGYWIWEGTVLLIPGSEGKNSKTTTVEAKDNISSQVSAFTYVDVASGKSDSVEITLMNIDKGWLSDKMPQKGATINATINTKEWGQGSPSFSCGSFIIDDISFSGRPLECVINGLSVPANNDFKTKKKTITWQSTTLRDIAQKIADLAGVELFYSGSNIKVSEVEQSSETDSAFLCELCEKYDFSIKVFSQKIVIFETKQAESKDSVAKLSEGDLLSWNYNTTIDGTYTGIEFSYTNPDNGSTMSVTVGSKGRMYYVNSQASSKYDAELQAAAMLNKANREIERMNISIRAMNNLVASQCITISGLGNASGKYYIDQIKHNIGSGYTMQLTLHKVQGGNK